MAGRLNLAGRSFNTNDSLSALEETNLAILSHPNLDDNAQFKELKGYLSKYYQDRQKPMPMQTMHTGQDKHWKDRLYCSLQSLLSELTYTSLEETQLQLLDKVYSWFRDKIGLQLPQITYRSPVVAASKREEKRPLTAKTVPANNSFSPYIPPPLYMQSRKREEEALKYTEARANLLNKWGHSKSKEIAERTRRTEQSLRGRPQDTNVKETQDGFYDFRNNSEELLTTMDDSNTFNRVQQIRQIYNSVIDVEKSPKKKRPDSAISSLYSDVEMNKFMNRRFSTDATDFSISKAQSQQMEEVLIIKSKLASLKINCTIQDLKSAMIVPDMPLLKDLTPGQLPRGGEGLMSNPKPKDKKKKKGKKKKGKKK